jgi:Leucine-rich repeat (LRR) protein
MASRLTVVLVSLLLATPVVIFWLWLVILPDRLATQCPEECICGPDGYYVNCSASSLNSIPSNLPTAVRNLILNNITLTYFQNDSFVSKGLVELEVLYADFCKLIKIELGAFNGLTKLTQLTLRGNEISEIIPGTFQNISRLGYLDLSYNRIEQLESDVFSGLVDLEYIDLVGNKLQFLHPHTFVRLPNLLTLNLSNNSALQIPTDRHFINSHSLKHLGISGCNVFSVSVETFANVSALEWLDLSENRIRSLDIFLLKVLPKLTKLRLNRNEISEIIPGTFENFSRLEYLELVNNRIEHLRSDVFSGLVNLKYIHLQGNKLQYLHPDTFVGLPNLQSLFLSDNSGLQIPTEGHFINSRSLKFLGISYCNLRSVSVETFANVSSLEVIDLSFNYLRSVDINILKALPKLSTLYLYFNPIHCDCKMQEVWRWCQDHNIQTASWLLAPKCYTPSEVKGLWWEVLEKGQCLQDNIHYYGDYKNTSYIYTLIGKIREKETNKSYNLVKHYVFLVVAVLFIFGTTFNIILIIIITHNKDMRTVPNMYILNLAVSDIIILILYFHRACINRFPDIRPQEEFVCLYYQIITRMSICLSVYSIVVLSVQRYTVTVNPLQFHVSSQLTWRATGTTICGLWIVAALFALPVARSSYYFCKSTFLYRTNYYPLLAIFYLIVSCLLPLFVTAFCYIITSIHLWKSSRPISEETQNPNLNTRKNTAKVLLGLIVVFLITYVPFHIFETHFCFRIFVTSSTGKVNEQIDTIAKLNGIMLIPEYLPLINSCLNPVALFSTSRAFRNHFKRYFTFCCKTNSPPTDLELANRN